MKKTSTLRSCPLCNGRVVRERTSVDMSVGRRKAMVSGDFARCRQCGEVYFDFGEAKTVMQSAAAQIREQEDLMRPRQIRALRESLALTQAQFEALLGVAPKTVVRWESGKVFQNAATDSLLRVLAAVPSAVTFLRRRNLSRSTKKSA